MTLEDFVNTHRCCAVNTRNVMQLLDIFDRIPFHENSIYPRQNYENSITDLAGVRFLDGKIKACNFCEPYTATSYLGSETVPNVVIDYNDLDRKNDNIDVSGLL